MLPIINEAAVLRDLLQLCERYRNTPYTTMDSVRSIHISLHVDGISAIVVTLRQEIDEDSALKEMLIEDGSTPGYYRVRSKLSFYVDMNTVPRGNPADLHAHFNNLAVLTGELAAIEQRYLVHSGPVLMFWETKNHREARQTVATQVQASAARTIARRRKR